MADRYWVGGTATWDATAGTKWATTSGGSGGASVPTSVDNVFLNAASGVSTVSLSLSSSICQTLNCTGFTGNLVMTSATFSVYGGVTFSTGMTLTNPGTCTVNLLATSGAFSILSNGKSFPGSCTVNIGVALNGSTAVVSLADAVTISILNVRSGTFNTSGFTATLGAISNSSGATINFGASTVFLTGTTPVTFSGTTQSFGTSQLNITNSQPTFNGGGRTFYNVAFTNTAKVSCAINGANIFNNLSITNRDSSGVSQVLFGASQTVNNTFTVTSSSNQTQRTFLRSSSSTTQQVLTCAAVSLTNVDFRSIQIAGAAAPASGTSLGDCKNNAGITFPAAKTVYFRSAGTSNWGVAFSGNWSFTIGGAFDAAAFPLAQDTAVFSATYPSTGSIITLNAAYNIGTIDMSARTTNTMTFATGALLFSIYGNWVNGTGTSVTGTQFVFFDGLGVTQTITSAGKTFPIAFSVTVDTGTVRLLDAFIINSGAGGLTLNSGTFDANGFNVSLLNTSNMQAASGNSTRTLAIGSGLWTIGATGVSAWNTGGTGFTATGTGTLRFTGLVSKSFNGNDMSYAGITLDQGGSGALVINQSNSFANITNSYASVGAATITFQSGRTTTVGNFTASGQSGRQLSINRTSTTNAILSKASGTVSVVFCTITGNTATGGATWQAYTADGNINNGNNVGWLFSSAPPASGNMLLMFVP